MWWLLLAAPLCLCDPLIAPKHEDDLKNVGNTTGYNIASDFLRKAMNISVDPCEDFFEFTCGNWIADHPIPSHKFAYSQFVNVSDKVHDKMREIFESKEVFGSKSMNALKAIYGRCIDKDELNRVGAKGLLESIKGYGVWPILDGDDKWRKDSYDLTSLLIQVFEVRGVNVFIKNSISLDNRNVSRRLIQFDQGDLALGESTRDFYLDKEKHGEKIEAYRKCLFEKVTQFLQDANLPNNRTKIASDVDEIIDLETKLAKIIVPEEDRRDYNKMYNLRRLSDMQKLMPLVDWNRYFYSVAPHEVHDYLASNPEILIVEIDYMRRIADLLRLTDPRIITNYIYMRYASSWGGELGEKYEDISQDFQRVMYGKKKKAPRWKDCTEKTIKRMKYAAGAMYVKKAFDQASKNVTQEMIGDLREAFQDMILTNDWMDAKTKASALDKANKMLQNIAFPDFILDNEKLDDYYKGTSLLPFCNPLFSTTLFPGTWEG
ncbi:peptidase family M13 [Ancylostoma ceylanicum]|uniref:Peptidase family M13 n=1 Tax=Ancylostoma ceylanicum TaxID=53326 RepID=A0A0D6LTY6_9BILA|nr:peptidase family M13 [Ancylostoma ceylanicum]